MTIHTNDVISTLNDLVEICRDSEKAYRSASQHVGDPHLGVLFTDYCRQRAQLAEELQFEIRRLGAEPSESGSLGGKLHHGWVELRDALIGHDDLSILEECERGEDVTLKHYFDATHVALPDSVHQIVRRQCLAVQAAHDRIRQLAQQHSLKHHDPAAH